MNKYYANDSIIVPFYIFEADEVTPAPAIDVTWNFVDPNENKESIYVEKPDEPTITQLGTGTLLGTYEYIYTNVNNDGFEGASSPILSIDLNNEEIQVEIPDAPLDIGGRRIYRRKLPNTVFRLVAEASIGNFAYIDNIADDDETETRTPSLVHGNTVAKFTSPSGFFEDVGLYVLAGHFLLVNENIRTATSSFQVVDPLAVATTDIDKVIDVAWGLLEDCFDSVEGGPWLQDQTKAIFDEEKFADFFNLALFNISIAQPPVTYDVNTFPYSTATPLLAKGILLEAIKHLMRSYVEQPLPVNDPTMHLQRRDYLERWKMIYDLEKAEYDMWLLLFKRDAYGFGQTAILVGGQSGLRTPRILRTRYPRFAGGWWGRF